MRTSLNEISLVDDYIFNRLHGSDKLLFDAMLILDSGLEDKIISQKQTHAMVKQYGRKKLKAEIEAVHQQLFSKPAHQSFGQKILRLFNK